MVTLQLNQLSVPRGQRLLLRNIRWQAFEDTLAEWGDRRATRLAYSNGPLAALRAFRQWVRQQRGQ